MAVSRVRRAQGPSKAQFTHLYLRENFLQSSSLQMSTWWQLGQLNLTALVPGSIGRLHELQWDSAKPSDMF
jgi:hypothetical protein